MKDQNSHPPTSLAPSRRHGASSRRILAGLLLGLCTAAQAQLSLPPAVTDTVDRGSARTDELRRELDRRAELLLAKQLRDNLPETLPESLEPPSKPLDALPAALTVLNSKGEVAFVEAEVEGGWRAVQQQWLVMLAPGELVLLEQLDASILERRELSKLGLAMVRFRVPEALDSLAALAQALPKDLVARLDRNHIYSPQADGRKPPAPATSPTGSVCQRSLKVGMVDTGIAKNHPGLAGAQIIERDFLSEPLSADDDFQQPRAHGTAVAGLLVAASEDHTARLPGAKVYNASVFYRRNQYAQGATMMHLVKGLNWLLEQDVSVINMSLSGPDNRVLAAAIERLIATGTLVVAAAGNEGPAAQPLYPAAYPSVIAATAVDSEQNIYRWANRGEHIDFAAPGVSVLTARSGGGFGRESGTSMAAPVVTAYVACALAEHREPMEAVIQRLATAAQDLGEPGRDSVYGYGLLP